MEGYDLADAVRRWLERNISGEDRSQAKVARALGVSQERLHHWITGRNRVPLSKLNDLAGYFKLGDDAALIAVVRRAFPAPSKIHSPTVAAGEPVPLEHPATPELIGEYLRESAAARRRRPPQQPAPRATTSKKRGTPRGA